MDIDDEFPGYIQNGPNYRRDIYTELDGKYPNGEEKERQKEWKREKNPDKTKTCEESEGVRLLLFNFEKFI